MLQDFLGWMVSPPLVLFHLMRKKAFEAKGMMWWWRTSVCSGKGGSGCCPASTSSSSPPWLRPESPLSPIATAGPSSPDGASAPATSSSSCFCGGRLPLSMVPHRSSALVRPLCLSRCGVPFSVPHLCLPFFASSLFWYAIYYIYAPSLLVTNMLCVLFLFSLNKQMALMFLPSFLLPYSNWSEWDVMIRKNEQFMHFSWNWTIPCLFFLFWLLDILGCYACQRRANFVGKSVDCFRLLLDLPYIIWVTTLGFLLLACLEFWLCGCMETCGSQQWWSWSEVMKAPPSYSMLAVVA